MPALAERLVSHKLMSPEEARPLARRAHIEQLRNMISDPQVQASYWNGLPKADLADAALLTAAVPLLAQAGQGGLARRAVERTLESHWDSELAAVYHLTASDASDAAASLSKAEEWLQRHPQDGGLLYSLGRQCMASRLWGKAEAYLQEALQIRPTPQTHGAFAELMEHLGRPKEAMEHYRLALAPPVPAPALLLPG